jgi:hypothetical protein
MTDANGLLSNFLQSHPRRRQVYSVDGDISVMQTKYSDTDTKLQAIDKTFEAGILLVSLKQQVNISEFNATTRKGGDDGADLSRNLGIGLKAANLTRDVTTQRGVKSMIYPSLNKREITNDRHMRYRRLPITLFTDKI